MSREAQGSGTGVEPAGEVGMFVFLAAEGLLFGGLLLTYLVGRLRFSEAFSAGSHDLSLPLGTANTAILLTSSFAVALSTIAAKVGRSRVARLLLAATAVLGVIFLAIKGLEYWDEAARSLLPFTDSDLQSPTADLPRTRMFFDVYLALTLTHALHLISGIVVVIGIAAAWRRLVRPEAALTLAALYWHFVDVLWVFLFPLLYLVR
jgi:cytochrome c oxidase subunit 3